MLKNEIGLKLIQKCYDITCHYADVKGVIKAICVILFCILITLRKS